MLYLIDQKLGRQETEAFTSQQRGACLEKVFFHIAQTTAIELARRSGARALQNERAQEPRVVRFSPSSARRQSYQNTWHSTRRLWLWLANRARELHSIVEIIQEGGASASTLDMITDIREDMEQNSPPEVVNEAAALQMQRDLLEEAKAIEHDLVHPTCLDPGLVEQLRQKRKLATQFAWQQYLVCSNHTVPDGAILHLLRLWSFKNN